MGNRRTVLISDFAADGPTTVLEADQFLISGGRRRRYRFD
jgi:hypothetical protein